MDSTLNHRWRGLLTDLEIKARFRPKNWMNSALGEIRQNRDILMTNSDSHE